MHASEGQYYSNIYVYGTPPAQFPAHLWHPSVSFPNPLLYGFRPTVPPNTPPLPTTTNEQLAAPGVARTGTASGGPATVGLLAPWAPAADAQHYGLLRAPRPDELWTGNQFNPATPLGLQP